MVVEIDGLTKRYGDVTAVRDLSLSVEAGEVYGFLGPNGAGKSTTINVMLDFARPTAGEVRVFGRDAAAESVAIRRRTGTLLEGYGVYPRLTGREHLEHAIRTKDADDDPTRWLDRLDLLEAADRPAGGYSKGMCQRMAIAMALVGDPDLLVLDEPTTGLDPNGARTIRQLVEAAAADGTTVFFSSHILEQVEAVADRVGILLDGELVAEGDLEDLRRELGLGATLAVQVTEVPPTLPSDLETLAGVTDVTVDDATVHVRCSDDGDAKLAALRTVADAGVYRDFTLTEASLEDVFASHTDGSATEQPPGGPE
jgi:ABC-2 type transport system ATP-binding protein